MGEFSGKVALVTGSSSGIGEAVARRLSALGASVVINSATSVDAGRRIAAELGAEAIYVQADIADKAAGERLLAATLGRFGRLDILVNNAGVLTTGAFQDVPLKTHEQMIDINFYGALAGLHAAFPYLRDTAGAQVVNMCSASAIYGQPELATYSATKFALRALTEALELEWRRYGIRVLAVWPLFVQTAMTDGVETGSTKTLGIHLKPEDVAKAVYSATHSGRRWLTRVHYPVGRLTGISQRTPGWAQRLITKTVTRS